MNEPPKSAERSPEPVGSLADEAARLFTAAQEWVRRARGEQAGAAGQLAEGLREAATSLGAQIGHVPECSLCPLCRALRTVRSTSPEVRDHLSTAATSLLQAVNGMLEAPVPAEEAKAPEPEFERIDLE